MKVFRLIKQVKSEFIVIIQVLKEHLMMIQVFEGDYHGFN
jgi:hypothetical protein